MTISTSSIREGCVLRLIACFFIAIVVMSCGRVLLLLVLYTIFCSGILLILNYGNFNIFLFLLVFFFLNFVLINLALGGVFKGSCIRIIDTFAT